MPHLLHTSALYRLKMPQIRPTAYSERSVGSPLACLECLIAAAALFVSLSCSNPAAEPCCLGNSGVGPGQRGLLPVPGARGLPHVLRVSSSP